ncbi:MAG: hypothetical protein NNA24_11150 [Nitrospira sp.]|nr:hypothetical protein [Nitrospira sp.]
MRVQHANILRLNPLEVNETSGIGKLIWCGGGNIEGGKEDAAATNRYRHR